MHRCLESPIRVYKFSILALRKQQAKNVFSILLISQGVPMLLAGDELLHSQQGNNNCYCQDNELSWLDWSLTEKNADTLRFVQQMIALRKRHPSIMRRRFLTGQSIDGKNVSDVSWHGVELNKPLWFDPEASLLSYTLAGIEESEANLHIILNMSDQATAVELPQLEGKKWCVAVDTSKPSPNDIILPEQQKTYEETHYKINNKSVVILESVNTKSHKLLGLF